MSVAPPSRIRRTRRSSGRPRRCRCRAARTRDRRGCAGAFSVDQVRVGIRALRILVQILHVRVAGDVVEVEVVLLDVLAVIAFVAGQAEHPLLEDRVGAVPQREREAQLLLVVADAGDAVLAPAVGARARVIVRQVLPRGPVGAVVLAHRAPLPLGQIRAPQAPRAPCPRVLRQSLFFRGQRIPRWRGRFAGRRGDPYCAGRNRADNQRPWRLAWLQGPARPVSAWDPRHVCCGCSVTSWLATAASTHSMRAYPSGVQVVQRRALLRARDSR